MKQKNEIWRDIIGYEGYYQASDEGRIRSLDRTVLTKNGQERFYKGKIFEGSFDMNGYKQVTLSRDGKQERFLIHQLVAVYFLNHTPNGHSLVIDHINGVKADNRVENLQIVTHRQNLSTCYRAKEDSFTSNFIGVNFCKTNKKWRAEIRLNSKIFFLGRFENEIDASDAYQKALADFENGTFKIKDYRASFTSKYKGITFNKASQKWMCQPTINGKKTYLGYHTTEESAHQAILEFEAIQPIVKNS